ncbi:MULTISPECIES: SpoIIE family protein phosphatase [unclassified Streptomyces]|uniref:SpoIIE family protein phosphatase n=1 Tax=unclassified Streptomyces TaxID=2593676 RepID=UPI0003752E96|nr:MULTISPECIES: SpoIIE family protein phosphatase [unclassified Streptomyces]MYX32891.1 SpoIIE family protein phosphatase [Streptomyces sp. SID8377]
MSSIAGQNAEGSARSVHPLANAETLDKLLVAAIREAVVEFDAVAGIAYLLEADGKWLRAAVVGGTPPAVFNMPERMPLNGQRASALACRTGRTAVIGEPGVRPDDVGPVRAPYAVVAVPLTDADHRYGALAVSRIPWRDGVLGKEQRKRLRQMGANLTRELAALVASGSSVLPGRQPLIFPVFKPRGPLTEPAARWGLPEVPGSAGLSWTYQVLKLADELNSVVTPNEVVEAARSRMMCTLGAQTLIVTAVADGRLWVVGHSGPASKVVRQLHGSSAVRNRATPVADVLRGSDPYFFPQRTDLLRAYPDAQDDGNQAWAHLPMRASGHPVGVCSLGWAEHRLFGAEAQAVMMTMADSLGQALERALLSEGEHALAESLQRRLLPRVLSDLPQVVTTARYLPAPSGGSGGDWYDVVALPSGGIGLVIGDVEGHSIESCVVMGQMRSAVLAYVSEGHRPEAVLTRASNMLSHLESELLATCCVVYLDSVDGTAEVALAGHPAPLIRGPDGGIETLDTLIGVPLGVPSPVPYQPFEATLSAGTVLFLYTDGLSKTHGPDVVTDAGRMLASASQKADPCLEDLADRLTSMVPSPPERRDDVALLFAYCAGTGPQHRANRMEIQRHDLRGVKDARKFVRDCLRSWRLEAVADDMELMASEIVTNALTHADSYVELRLRLHPDRVRLEVRDTDVTPPLPSSLSACEEENARAEHGRGLIIVDALGEWGISPSGRGKVVWCEIAVPR